MVHLLDTNILLRLSQVQHPQHKLVSTAADLLIAARSEPVICAQNLVEFWNAATRPVEKNGFGMTPPQAAAEVDRLEGLFRLLSDHPGIHQEWKRLARKHGVSGAKVHDARLAAVALFHQVDRILTLNASDFTRFDGVEALHPQDVVDNPPAAAGIEEDETS